MARAPPKTIHRILGLSKLARALGLRFSISSMTDRSVMNIDHVRYPSKHI